MMARTTNFGLQKKLWLAVVLAAGFIALAGYHWANRGRYEANAELLRHLQTAVLPAAEDKPLGRPGDWPQWRGPWRDGVSRETGLLTEWPADGPMVLWQVPMQLGYSSMAVADGRLFTQFQDGGNEVVVCLDAESGQERWHFSYPCTYKVDPSYGPCPRSTPTVDGNRVYTVGGNGLLHCLEAPTGKLLWKHDLLAEYGASLPQWAVASSPLIEGDLLITQPGGPDGNSIVAFEKHYGNQVWKSHDDPAGYSSPIAAQLAGQRQLIVFTGKSVVGVSPKTGQVYWRYPWETSHDINAATPIVRGDYVLISSNYGKGCALLKVSVRGEGKFHVAPVYEHNELCNHFSSSVLFGEHVYGFNEDMRLVCMEFRTFQYFHQGIQEIWQGNRRVWFINGD